MRIALVPLGRALGALACAATGGEHPDAYLALAWKWLLQNHPHDSICGCSIDQVHEDMKYRFSQCRRIAERLTIEALRRLAAAAAGEVGESELRLAVFNPFAEPLRQTAEVTLQIPEAWPSFNEFFGYEPKPAFRIYDVSGDGSALPAAGPGDEPGEGPLAGRQIPGDVSDPRRDGVAGLGCSRLRLHHAQRPPR